MKKKSSRLTKNLIEMGKDLRDVGLINEEEYISADYFISIRNIVPKHWRLCSFSKSQGKESNQVVPT